MSQDTTPLSSYRAEVRRAKSRYANAHRKSVAATPREKSDASRDLAAANLAAYVAEKVAAAPPLTPEQIETIRGILHRDNGAAR